MKLKTRADKGARKTKWVTLECATCGKPFEVPPWAAKERRFCSGSCRPRQDGPCQAEGCTKDAFSKGFCAVHYMRERREDPEQRAKDVAYSLAYYKEHPEWARRNTRRSNLMRYGITSAEWDAKFVEQDGKCAICGTTENANGHRLAVDHCHETGTFRGLLCHSCNRAIGLLGDNPERLRAATLYIEQHR